MEWVSSTLSSVVGRAGPSKSMEPPEGAVGDAVVSSIFIYPIKSCRGISVPEASITPTGFRWDRQWIIVNSKRAYTQRTEPMLALIEVELPKDSFRDGWVPSNESYLVLRAPGMNELKVSLKRTSEIMNNVSVWEWTGSAYDEGQEASDWLTEYLGKPGRLVCFNTSSETRVVDPKYAPGYKTTFSDGFPFMLISQGSLNKLNEFLDEPLPINRFRTNILVDGCPPFSEDLWMTLKINKLTFHGVKLCSRCKVPTINQETGIAGAEPTTTLMKFRSDNALRQSNKSNGKVYFGQNLVCGESQLPEKGKMVKVGDPLYVLKRFSSVLDAPA